MSENMNISENPYENVKTNARKTLVILFLLDSSGSMWGQPIGRLNDVIRSVLPMLQNTSDGNADAKTKVAFLKFDNEANWITPSPVDPGSYTWHKLEANGLTAFGAACSELNHKLSEEQFFCDTSGYYSPVIFLLSDGAPNDDYKTPLEELKRNKWFKAATKVAFSFEDKEKENKVEEIQVRRQILAEFTGDIEMVFPLDTPEKIYNYVKAFSMSVSKSGSSRPGMSHEEEIKGIANDIETAEAADTFEWPNIGELPDGFTI